MTSSQPVSSSSRASLIRLCVECCDSYPPSRVTPFAHLDHFARSQHPHLSQSAHSAALDFVSSVFLGVDRLHELLSLTADGLYTSQAAHIARRDRTLYIVYLLLILDRAPRVGWDDVAAYIRCQPPQCMLPLLNFLFDTAMQDGWMRQQWQTLYDLSHVDAHLIHHLRQHQLQAEPLMDRLSAAVRTEQARKEEIAAQAGGESQHGQRAATIPRPFTLSQSKPKALPAPVGLTTTYRASEVAASVTRSLSLQQIEQRRQQRRQVIREQTVQALNSGAQPTLTTSQRPSSLNRVRQAVEERLLADTRQLSFARPVPATLHTADADAATHKATAATILREENRYRKERAEEAERLLRFECELRDEAAFQQWRSRARAEDEQRRREDIARRKHVMAQAQHDAQVSVQRLIQHKQREASSSKEERDRQLHARQVEEETQRRRREESVKQLSHTEEEAVQASLSAVRRRKKEAAEAVTAESRQLNEEREARSEQEAAEKRRLMCRIQAMEKLAAERAKRTAVVEESSTGGLNLLSDMSVAEMRARLAWLEEVDRLHIQRKRQRIQADKRTRADVLSSMQQQHAAVRAQQSEQREAERRQKRVEQQTEAQQVEAALAQEGRETVARMEERKKEVLAAALSLASQVAANQQLTSKLQREAVHSREKAQNDVRTAADRRVAANKQRADRQQRVDAEAEQRKLSDLSRVRAAVKQQTEGSRQEADRRLAEAVSESTRAAAEDSRAHSAQHRAILEQRQRLRQTIVANQPFAVQASESDVQRGKQTAQQRRLVEEQWRSTQRAALSQQSVHAGQSVAAAQEEKQQLSGDDATSLEATLTAMHQQPDVRSNAIVASATAV